MSAPVDVMAVLRYNAKEATKKWGPDNQDSATLAAVAELIEAASEVQQAEDEVLHWDGDAARGRLVEAKRRHLLALARVKGRAA